MNPPEGLPQCCFGAAHDEPGYRCEEIATWRSVKSRGLTWCSDHAANFRTDEVEPIEAVRAEPELSATLSEPQIESSPTPDVWNPLDHGIIMVPAHQYIRLESERDALKAENGRLRKLVLAIEPETYGGIYAKDVDEKNWFDARAEALAGEEGA